MKTILKLILLIPLIPLVFLVLAIGLVWPEDNE